MPRGASGGRRGTSRHLQDGGQRAGESCPVLALLDELSLPRAGERIPLGLAPVLGGFPLEGDEPPCLEPVERRIQRAGVDVQHLARRCLDPQGEIISVGGLGAQELEDDELEGALQEGCGSWRHGCPLEGLVNGV